MGVSICSIRPNDAVAATAAAKYAVETLKAENIALLYCNNTFGTGGYEIVKAELEKMGIKPVTEQDHGEADLDYTAQLMAIQSANADTVIAWEIATPSGFISKQIKQLGLEVNLIGSPAWTISDVIKTAAGGHEGTMAVNDGIPWTDTHPDPDIAAKAVKYHERTGGYNNFGAAYYDAVYMVKLAAENAAADGIEEITTDVMAEYLHKIEGYVGVANTFSFNEKGEGVHSAAIVKVENDIPVYVATVEVD